MTRRLPREMSGDELIRKLGVYGYKSTRQTGSHVRVTRVTPGGEQHLTIPQHKSLRVGTLNAILSDVAAHLGQEKHVIIDELFGNWWTQRADVDYARAARGGAVGGWRAPALAKGVVADRK